MLKAIKRKYRETMSDDYILGYYDAIAEMGGKLGLIKNAFDLKAYQLRATKKVDKRTRAKSNTPTPDKGGG